MAANGSPAPLFDSYEDRLSLVIRLPCHPLSRSGLQQALDLKDAKHFRKAYLLPALASGLVEMTRPETPRSSKQCYRRPRLRTECLDQKIDQHAHFWRQVLARRVDREHAEFN